MGDRDGPTVILDAAAGSLSAEWAWVQPEIAPFTQVVAYDRPGLGRSDAPPTPLNATSLVEDLRAALHAVGADGPYVLVGHSMGGLVMRTFAKLHPDEVAGVVLVDSRYLGIDDVVPEQERAADNRSQLVWQMPLLARLGVFRLQDINGEYIDQLPSQAATEARAALASTHHWRGFVPDTYVGDSAERLLRQEEDLGKVPLIVLSAEQPDPYNFSTAAERARFTALHAHMATTLSSHGTHRIVAGADHGSIVTHQKYAQAVVAAIREVIQQTQTPH
jgi:pimeloyl-ACP methyl ester carboxylesterase